MNILPIAALQFLSRCLRKWHKIQWKLLDYASQKIKCKNWNRRNKSRARMHTHTHTKELLWKFIFATFRLQINQEQPWIYTHKKRTVWKFIFATYRLIMSLLRDHIRMLWSSKSPKLKPCYGNSIMAVSFCDLRREYCYLKFLIKVTGNS